MMTESFDLNDFVDAATGESAAEVITNGGPGHYELNYKLDLKPSASEMLEELMTKSHDSSLLSVTLPVRKLMAVRVEIGNLERKCQGNGQAAAQKAQELLLAEAQLRHCEQVLEVTRATIGRVWTLLENESPYGEDLRADDVRNALIGGEL